MWCEGERDGCEGSEDIAVQTFQRQSCSLESLFGASEDLLLGFHSGLALSVGQSLSVVSLLFDGLLLLLLVEGIGANGLVGILVDTLEVTSLDASLDETRELLFEGSLIVLLKLLHVFG